MMTTNDGGSAFPTPDCSAWDGPTRTPGMTLRDWLAGQALTGLFAASIGDRYSQTNAPLLFLSEHTGLGWNASGVPEKLAGLAYAVADAMLARRAELK